MRRRIIHIPVVTALAVSALVGCSNNPQGESRTLTMFASTDAKSAYEPVIKAFEGANPGVKINVTWGSGNEFESTEATQLTSGSGPDLVDVLPGTGGNLITVGSLVKQGHLEDLSGTSWAAEIPDSLRSQTDINGKTYVLPGLLQPLGAFYNTQALQETGLRPPATWSELLKFCAKAKAGGKVPFSLGLSDQWVGQLVPYALAATLVYGPTPDWNAQLQAGKVTFPDSAWEQVFGKYLELQKAGCFSADPNGISFDNTLPPVAKGEAVAIVQVGGVFGQIQNLNKDARYQFQALPATDDAKATYIPASPGHGVGVNAKSLNKKLAIDFVNFMALPKNLNAMAKTVGGGVPAISNQEFQPAELLNPFNDLVAAGHVSPFPDTGWPNPQIQNAQLVGIQNLFLGKATPEQVLTAMQEALN